MVANYLEAHDLVEMEDVEVRGEVKWLTLRSTWRHSAPQHSPSDKDGTPHALVVNKLHGMGKSAKDTADRIRCW